MEPMPTLGYVTVPDLEVGRGIARVLVEERWVACANLLGPLRSVYRWDGHLAESDEYLLLCKTVSSQTEAATARIVELHPYELPCVVWLPLHGGHPPFLDWIESETRRA